MAVHTPILGATGVVSLGNASSGVRTVGRIVAQVVGASWTGSAVPKVRAAGAGLGTSALKTIAYLNVATGAILAPGTAITADGVYEFPANGLEVVLDYTHTSGQALVYVIPVEGPGTPSGAALLYNESTFDLQRGNTATGALNAVARTTTYTSADTLTYNARGCVLSIVVSNIGTGSLTAAINGKDAFGNVYNLLTGAAIVTNSTNVYRVFPGALAAANAVANDVIPKTLQFVVTANNANPVTYQVAYGLTV